MICYKDKTFCSFYDECQDRANCFRALTDIIKENAQKIGMPISQFVDKPDCFLDKRDI